MLWWDDLDDTINKETWELLEDDQSESFLLKNLTLMIDQTNMHLYSACDNEIDEKKPELEDLPSHLEYAYLHGNESFPIIISSKLSEKEKRSLLQVLEKQILMEDDFKPVIQP
ncbi:hypothetical protein Tco_0239729 [Tanacetum coccineum]